MSAPVPTVLPVSTMTYRPCCIKAACTLTDVTTHLHGIGTVINVSAILSSGTCPKAISSEQACRAAVSAIATLSSSVTVSNSSLPTGCIMVPNPDQTWSYTAVFNSASSSQPCGFGKNNPICLKEDLHGAVVGAGTRWWRCELGAKYLLALGSGQVERPNSNNGCCDACVLLLLS